MLEEEIFLDLQQLKSSHIEVLDIQLQNFCMRYFNKHNSKTIFRHFIYDIFSITETRLLVITAHVYFTHILTVILERHPNKLAKHKREKFQELINFAYAENLLDDYLYTNLRVINKFRNKLAHELFYSISAADLLQLTDINTYNLRIPRKKNRYHSFTALMLKIICMKVFRNLAIKNKTVYLIDARS